MGQRKGLFNRGSYIFHLYAVNWAMAQVVADRNSLVAARKRALHALTPAERLHAGIVLMQQVNRVFLSAQNRLEKAMDIDGLLHYLRVFNTHGVRYLVIGGFAVVAHGHQRTTDDLDVWIEPSHENGQRILTALAAAGEDTRDLMGQNFVEYLNIFAGPGLRFDMQNYIPGVSFADAWEARHMITLEETSLPFIHLRHLIENKKAVGRKQDLADVEALESLQSDVGDNP